MGDSSLTHLTSPSNLHTMKKVTYSLMIALCSILMMPVNAGATNNPNAVNRMEPTTAEAEAANKLLNRLYEIDAMDVKNMAKAEKKQLRNEVKAIKHDLKDLSGGVYLSVGAAIIIILLLILLL